MKDGLKVLVFAICLAGCVGLALTMSIIVIISWAGGPEGMVNLTTNLFHERLAETILFPVWTIMGFVASYFLLVTSCEYFHFRRTNQFDRRQGFFKFSRRPAPWVRGAPAPVKLYQEREENKYKKIFSRLDSTSTQHGK